MSHELLQDPRIEHDVHHDNESFFYIILFMAIMFVGPNDRQRKDSFPKFLRHWLKPSDEQMLGDLKCSMINTSDLAFEERYLVHVTDYFSCLKPLLHKLKQAIKTRTLSHDFLISSLTEAITALKAEKAVPPKKTLSTESPVDRILVPDDLIDTKEIEMHSRLRGLGPINGPGSSIKGVRTFEAAYNTPLPLDADEEDEDELTVGKIPAFVELAKKTLGAGSKDDSFLKMLL